MYQQLRLEPYAVHTTFQYAGTEGKRHRLREGMVFYDPPEYYDAPGTNIKYHQYLCHALHIFSIFLGCIFLATACFRESECVSFSLHLLS